MALKEYWTLVKTTGAEWYNDKCMRMGGALAYYTALSLAPLLLIIISVTALVFGEQAATGQLVGQIRGLIGNDGAKAIQDVLAKSNYFSGSIISCIIGVVTLILSATGVFAELQDSLNTIWEVQPKPGGGIWGTIKDRFLSFTLVLGIGFLLLVSLVVSAALQALGNYAQGLMPQWSTILQVINFFVTLGIFTLLFAMIFKFLPDVKIGWKDVWFGAATTALLFALGKYLIGLYLGTSSIGSTYGAAGSFVVLLVWIYYSSLILFLGAEFTKVYATQLGSRIRPASNAEPVTADARAEQGLPPPKHPAQAPATKNGVGDKQKATSGK